MPIKNTFTHRCGICLLRNSLLIVMRERERERDIGFDGFMCDALESRYTKNKRPTMRLIFHSIKYILNGTCDFILFIDEAICKN